MAVFQVDFMAETLGRTVPIIVILPTDKVYFPGMPRREEGKPYKTLYLLHGVIGDCTDWLYGTRIRRWAEEKDLCVVMPSGDNAFYLDQPWAGNNYSEFVGRELVEFTRKTFPLSRKKEDTYIGGLSMGGYGAIYNGFKFNKTFGAVIGLSSAMTVDETLPLENPDPKFPIERTEVKKAIFGDDLEAVAGSEKNPRVLISRLLEDKKELPKLYMACGNDDFLKEKNDAFVSFLKENGVEHTYETGPGSHEWDFWDTYIKKALEWLPLEDAVQGRTSGNVGLSDV
ncbi:MAG: acetylesterase [Blautia sp.]|nr:acetylesterase [Blautia sp.]